MRTIVICLGLLLLVSCNVKPEPHVYFHLKRQVNQRLFELRQKGDASNISMPEIDSFALNTHKIFSIINVADASTKWQAEADEMFVKIEKQYGDSSLHFIRVSDIGDKTDAILAIQLNELSYLDYLLLPHKSSFTCPPKLVPIRSK